MARRRFGTSANDWVVSIDLNGALRAISATLTAWDARTGGTQITDLLDADDQPISEVAVTRGQWEFYGPDGVTELWVDAGGADRELVTAEGATQVGGDGGDATWPVPGTPSTFPPAAHQHPAGQVTGLAGVATTGAYGDLTGRPSIPTTPGAVGADPVGAAALVLAQAKAYADALSVDLTALVELAEESDDIAALADAVQALADAPPEVTQGELDAEAAARLAGDEQLEALLQNAIDALTPVDNGDGTYEIGA